MYNIISGIIISCDFALVSISLNAAMVQTERETGTDSGPLLGKKSNLHPQLSDPTLYLLWYLYIGVCTMPLMADTILPAQRWTEFDGIDSRAAQQLKYGGIR